MLKRITSLWDESMNQWKTNWKDDCKDELLAGKMNELNELIAGEINEWMNY